MIAKNVTMEEMQKTLESVNTRYQGNIKFKTLEHKGNRISFTLTVIDSKEPGHRRILSGKRLAAACFHVHGHFFDTLFEIQPAAGVYSSGSLANPRTGEWITKEGGNWQDWQVGGYPPMMVSQACDCNTDAQAGVERLVQGPIVFRKLSTAQIRKCPLFIFDPAHYLPDGSCLCTDKEHQQKLIRERVARRKKLLKAQKGGAKS
uniref:Uncharacterized protein n=1 Tax=viral metagenome TaxID=1070528 RepID=A0A6M3JGW2_9ZZZZ